MRFTAGASRATKTAAITRANGRSLRAFGLVPGLELVRTALPAAQAIARLRSQKGVASVTPDCIVRIDATPNDPGFAQQWALSNTGQTGGTSGADIGAADAWDVRTSASGVVVAIIDTGMHLTHADLAANLWINTDEIAANGIDDDGNGYVDDRNGWDFLNGDPLPVDDNGHGTHVAGTIGARGNNGLGVTGVAWSVQLMPLKAFNAQGQGSVSAIIAALDYAVANGADISNHSYGSPEFVRDQYDAFVAATGAGHLSIAAAGNAGQNADEVPHYPAAYRLDGLLSVAATTHEDTLAGFSNYGSVLVHLAAPGEAIQSTVPSGYGQMSGTSMATPHVTGVAALLAGEHPTWTGTQIRERILGTTRPVAALAGLTRTGGVVDAGAALSDAPTVLPPPLPAPVPQTLTTTVDPNPAPDPVAAPEPPVFPEPEVLESSPVDLGPPQIALDAAGNPMIAHARWTAGVELLTRSGAGWSRRQLTDAHTDFYWLALAVDGAGVPTVAVQRSWSALDAYSDPGVLLVGAGAAPVPSSLRITAACPDADSCFWDWTPEIAYDGAGAAHVVFTRTDGFLQDAVTAPAGSAPAVTGTGAYYATNASGAWVVRRLTTGSSDGPVEIAVEDDGTVHLALRRRAGSASGLYHLTNEGGSWSSLQLTDHVEDHFASIGVDTEGGVHLAFARPGLGLYVMERTATGSWAAPALVYDGNAYLPELAVDGSGDVHVAFGVTDGSNTVAGVQYATNKSGAWVLTTVAGGQGSYPSLAVDPAGHAFLVYQQWVGAPLGTWYATNVGGAFVSTLVEAISSEGGMGGTSAYAVDADGHGHVAMASRYGEAAAGLYYGTDETGSWVFSRIDPGWPTSVALALDAAGNPHVAYALEFNAQSNTWLPANLRRISYATRSAGPWRTERVTPGSDFSSDGLAITVTAAGQPQVLYADAFTNQLLRARRGVGSWTIDAIYGGSVIRHPSATLDETGTLHVALIASVAGSSGQQVMYVSGTTGSWTSSQVTSGSIHHAWPALARSSDGSIWIADWRLDGTIQVHRRSAAGEWTGEQIEAAADASWPAIATNGGDVHVVYGRGTFYGGSGCTVPMCEAGPGLRHAVLSGGTWTITKLSPYWHDTLPMLARGQDGSLSVAFHRSGMGLRALGLLPPRPSATIRLQPGSDSGSSATDNRTNSSVLTWDVTFNRPVTGFTTTDLTRTGTATGCIVGAPQGAGAAYTVTISGCSAGTVTLGIRADAVTDEAEDSGPAGPIVGPAVLIDRTRPTNTAPSAVPRLGGALSGTAIPLRLTWSAADGGGAGIARYEVARSLNGSTTWTLLTTTVTTPSLNALAAPSGTVRYRVRAVDRAGNVGLWVTGPALAPRLLQQTSSAISYGGSWATASSTSYSGGSARYASVAGRSASYTFTGRSVAFVSTRALSRGKVKIYVNGVYLTTVDLRGATMFRAVLWQRTWSSPVTRRITFVVSGTAGRPRIDLDALVVVR